MNFRDEYVDIEFENIEEGENYYEKRALIYAYTIENLINKILSISY